jgi:hypothetical protein
MSSRKLCGTLVETPLAAKSTLVRGAADLVVALGRRLIWGHRS